MRSSELARLAGVTVRTLRHYHHAGILPEPERSANGYREYRVTDLIRLLRTARLRELGLSLAEIQPLLEDPEARVATLERAEAELDAEITRLVKQRDHVRQVRAKGLLPELGPLANAIDAHEDDLAVFAELGGVELEQLVLFGHLADPEQLTWMVRAQSDLAGHTHGQDPAIVDLGERFLATPADAPDEVWETLLADMLSTHGDFFRALVASTRVAGFPEDTDLSRVLSGHLGERLSPAHRTLLDRFLAEVEGTASCHCPARSG